jgi:TRAP-type mannitol/chloroaromatic compound transport system substrate-binding protein
MYNRRGFTAGILGTAVLATPSIAQTAPEVRWRLQSSFPKSLDALYGACEFVAQRVAQLTNNRFQIQVFAAGEIVPPFGVLDATSNGTIELCQSASHYFIGKDPAFVFGTTTPFGLNTRLQNAWMMHGGGNAMLEELYASYNVSGLVSGNSGTQMGGWFRKEINTVEDLKGLRFRIPGIAGEVLAKLGVIPQTIAGGDVYPALERGTIDAAEWVGPHDDLKLGFHKVAPYYYYPGWWEGNTVAHTFVNREKLAALPKAYRAALEASCAEANTWMVSRYDYLNPPALRKLIEQGAQVRAFPNSVLEACFKAGQVVMEEKASTNARFAKMYESMREFRREGYRAYQLMEGAYDQVMMSLLRQRML